MLIITLFYYGKRGNLWHGECMRSTECLLVVSYDWRVCLACVCGVIGRDTVYGHEMTISGTLCLC